MKRNAGFFLALAAPLAACVLLAGCEQPASQGQGSGPPTITVSNPLQRDITDYAEYTGRTAAVDAVDVRAQVGGYLVKINFQEGAEVDKGTVLYEIDPRPYQAAVTQAEAQVALQEANLKYQEAVYRRNVRLQSESQAVDVETVQQSLAQRDTTRAQLQAARANLEQAKLNLEWTRVQAPISGRIDRTLLTTGNLVIANQTLLTTLVSQDPMYAYFDVDEPTVLRVQELIREGKLPSVHEKGARIPVFLGLASEQGYPHEGYLDFVSNQVSATTGTLQVRGVFANPQPSVGPRVLSPGQFVRIRVAVSAPYQALLVIQSAIASDQNLNYVNVVDEQNRVVRREVELGTIHEGLQVVTQGVKANDRVVIEGLQHVHPGTVINPQLVPMPVPSRAGDNQQPAVVLKNPPTAPAKR